MADSEVDLGRMIAAADAAGLEPQYITVSSARRTYKFPVYANVTRSNGVLFVVAYSALYEFGSTARVHYMDSEVAATEIPIDKLPFVRAPGLEGASAHRPRALARCPDCLAVVTQKARIAALTESWPSQADPWQRSPRYAAWIPLPKNPPTPPP